MEPNIRHIYLHEIQIQCNYALRSLAEFNAAMKRSDILDIFRTAHHLLTHISNVSRILWPAGDRNKTHRGRPQHRAVELRRILDLPDDHLLKARKLRNHLEHFDTRLDDWAHSRPNRIYVDMNVGPRHSVQIDGLQDSDRMRHIDPATKSFIFRGEVF